MNTPPPPPFAIVVKHELGIVLFGLPIEETSNKLNEANGGYEGVKELCM